MKLKKWFAAVLVLALLLTGCADGIVEIDDSALRPNAEVLLNSFVANDPAACRGVLDENVSSEDLEGYFTAIHTELKDLGSYEMTAIAWDRKIMNEEDVTGIRYLIEGEGGYTHKHTKIVMVVCNNRETPAVMDYVKQIDPNAFMTVASVMGVYGQGFQPIKL